METILVYPQKSEELKTLKTILKALKMNFEVSPYNQEFVKKIKKSSKEIEKGEFVMLDPKNIWESILSK
jgi:hypothetical protein